MIAIEENRKLGDKRKLKRFSDRQKERWPGLFG